MLKVENRSTYRTSDLEHICKTLYEGERTYNLFGLLLNRQKRHDKITYIFENSNYFRVHTTETVSVGPKGIITERKVCLPDVSSFQYDNNLIDSILDLGLDTPEGMKPAPEYITKLIVEELRPETYYEIDAEDLKRRVEEQGTYGIHETVSKPFVEEALRMHGDTWDAPNTFSRYTLYNHVIGGMRSIALSATVGSWVRERARPIHLYQLYDDSYRNKELDTPTHKLLQQYRIMVKE